MSGGIYVLHESGQLDELNEHLYDSEALLQELLAKYPSLLAGNQIDPAAPRRWVLVTREARLTSEPEGAGRWSVDHLFLDQDAIPTLVEVKRSTDTRIRREVVGQMLDYAANAVVYWPVEFIRSRFDATCQGQGLEPLQVVSELIGSDREPEEFWQAVKTNLQAGRIRLMFVADEVPAELQRVVEFLNAQMDPAEVLAVEVKQYVGPTLKTLVPRVLGQSANAQRKKGTGTPEPSPGARAYQSFFAELLDSLRKARPDATTATKTQPASWFWFAAGRSGLNFSWAFTADRRFKTELYIDTPDAERNREILETLAQDRTAIEQQLGMALEWEPMEHARASRIVAYAPISEPVSITSSKEVLDRIAEWAVPTMVQFVDVFRPRIRTLP